MRIAICPAALCGGLSRWRGIPHLVALITFVSATAAPSSSQAQVTGLGTAADFGVLENGGIFQVHSNLSLSVPTGADNVGVLGTGGYLDVHSGATLSIGGTLYYSSASTGQLISGTLSAAGGETHVSATTPNVLSTAWTAATTASASDAAQSSTTSISSNTITGTQAVNIVNVSSITSGLTINGNGSGDQVFVINVGSGGIKLSNVTLTGGVTASEVIFNVTNGGTVTLGAGTVNGTFLDTGSGAVTLNGTTLNGSVIAGSGGVSIAGSSTINAQPFATSAPELPTISIAAVACLLVLGRAGLQRIKRARAA